MQTVENEPELNGKLPEFVFIPDGDGYRVVNSSCLTEDMMQSVEVDLPNDNRNGDPGDGSHRNDSKKGRLYRK